VILTFLSCVGTGEVTTRGKIPLGPMGTIEFSLNVGGSGRGEVDNQTSTCFDVAYKDKNGRVIGTGKLKPGLNRVVIPAGTKKFVGVSVVCDDDNEDDLVARGPGRPRIGWDREIPYRVVGGPLDFDERSPDGNAVYSFVVRAHDPNEAEALVSATLEQPIGTTIDSRVTIQSFYKTELNSASGSIVAQAREPFVAFGMDVNGVTDYATLGHGAVQTQVGPDLWMVEAPVDYSDIHGMNSWNDTVLRTQRPADPGMQITSYGMILRPK
jgi:hypothetical protein